MKNDIKTNWIRLLTLKEKEFILIMGRHNLGFKMFFRKDDKQEYLSVAESLLEKNILQKRKTHYLFKDIAWEIFDELMNEKECQNKNQNMGTNP